MDIQTQIARLQARLDSAEQTMNRLNGEISSSRQVWERNQRVIFGDDDLRREGLLEMVPSLNKQMRETQTQIRDLIEKMERDTIAKQAVAAAQDATWKQIKLWGGVGGSVLGIIQLANILLNLAQ